MKKLFVMAAMVLSSVGAFAQQAAGTTTIIASIVLMLGMLGIGLWLVKKSSNNNKKKGK